MAGTELTRRELLRLAAVVGGASAAGVWPLSRLQAQPKSGAGATTMLSTEETTAISEAVGKTGNAVAAEATYVIPLPRNDLEVKIKGEPVPGAFGFAGWVAFKKTLAGDSTVMMGDSVLLQEEVNPVISAAQANKIEITALHNHFFWEEPRVFFMHLHGMGEAGDLARRYAAAIRPSKLLPASQPPPPPPPAITAQQTLNLPALDGVIGHQGTVNGAVYKYTVGRQDVLVTTMGAEITSAMGLNSWAAFCGTMEEARVAGDIAMLESEVNPVIAALRGQGLEVVAVHNHMLGDDPRIIFLHHFGKGPASQLAQGFRAALNQLGKHLETMTMPSPESLPEAYPSY